MAAHSPTSALRELIGEGWIGPVHCGGHEILRRLFVSVRDRHWQEIRPTQFDAVIDELARTVRLTARHTSELVDFEWQGDLTVSEDGGDLRFAFEGRALRDMEICRLGLIVLHPVEGMIGARLTASNGHTEHSLTVGRQLAPQPILNGVPGAMTEPFTRLSIERDDLGQVLLSLAGDSFELEDQRNWGDASFKTYCTPLRLGFPRAVEKGTVIAHSVDVQFTPAQIATPVVTTPREQPVEPRLPTIGRVWHGQPMRDLDSTWDHIHADLTGRDHSALRHLLESSPAQQFEIGLDATAGEQHVAEWVALFRTHRERIARLLFYGQGTSLPNPAVIERWRDALHAAHDRPIPLFAATRGYFVEFNRSVPFSAPVTGIAFPLTATVHSDDSETVMSNVGTVRDMIETARRLTRTSDIALAPLALYHPPIASPSRMSSELVLPWLAATLHHAAAAGVGSITLADDLAKCVGERTGIPSYQ